MNMQNDLNAIIECLKITYTSADMKLRLQAEEKLSLYEANITLYTKLFIQTITTDMTIDSKTKLAIVLQLNRAIAKYINTQVEINKIEVIEVIKVFAEALINSGLEVKLIQNLFETFKSLLNYLEECPEILTQFSIYLCQSLNSSTLPYKSFQGIIPLFSSIILCTSFSKHNELDILKQIIPFAKKILVIEYENLQSITNVGQDKNRFIDHNKTIGDAYSFYFTLSFKLRSKASNELKALLDVSFEEVIILGIKHLFTVVPNYVPYPPICWSNDSEIDSCLNKTKMQILRFICSVTANLPDTISNKEALELHMEMIKSVSANLEYILLNKYKEIHFIERANDNKYTLLITQMILYINKALSKKTIRNEFKQFEVNFFKNIILPFLIITKAEIDQSLNDPSDYSVIIEDAMFNHTNKTIKSAACLLLKTFTTSSSEEFISHYMMEIFDSVFNQNSNSNKMNQLLTINDFIVKINLNQEMRLDLCLLVFSILKKHFYNRQIEIDFCVKLNECFNLLFSEKANDYIKHKVCIVLSQYFNVFQSIDDDSNAITISCIQYLFRNVFLENNLLVAQEATQTLNNIIEQSKLIYKLHRPLINHLFVEILKIIPKTKIINVFDVIYQIRSNIEPNELDIQLFVTLCNRISVEAAQKNRLKFKVQQKTNKTEEEEEAQAKQSRYSKPDHELYITKCFNIIRYLVENETFVISNLTVIETNLKPLIFYMKNPANIDFDEDMILIMINLVKYSKSIPTLGYDLMPELYKYALKCKGMLNDLFELVSLFLMHGSSIIEQNETYCKAILDVFKYGSTDEKFNESPFYVAILIHFWFLISNTIPSQVVSELLINAIDNIMTIFVWLNDPNMKAELSEAKYSFIGWLLVIYTSFINYASVSISVLTNKKQLSNLLLWTEYCLKLKSITYPIKMLVFALAKIINSEYFINDNGQFINFGLRFLLNQRLYESNRLKNSSNQKAFLKYERNDDDEDNEDSALDKNNEADVDDDDDKENHLNTEADLESLISNLNNPHSNIDEFKEFKIAMETFKNNKPQQFIQWLGTLSDCDKDNLNTILVTVRVDFENKTDFISIPRKIVKVKRNNV